MRYRLLLLFGLALPYRAAAQGQPTMRDLSATPIKVRGVDCALFPAIAQLDTIVALGATTHRFTPSREQVEAIEKQLRTEGVRTIRTPSNRYDAAILTYIQKHLRHYKRQYFGFYNAQQQPYFFIQLLLDTDGMYSSWLSGQLLISDGGASVCELYYNLTTHKFYGLGYHGSA